MNNKSKGFTLIEILISILILSISFILIQRTFFTLQKNVIIVEQKMNDSEILFKFFTNFNTEMGGICDLENIKLNSKEISFTTLLSDFLYPLEITYKIEDSMGYKILLRKQKNIFTDYEFTLSVLNAEDIEFLFFIDGEWKYEIEKDKKPDGIGIKIIVEGKEVFYPTYLVFEREDE